MCSKLLLLHAFAEYSWLEVAHKQQEKKRDRERIFNLLHICVFDIVNKMIFKCSA